MNPSIRQAFGLLDAEPLKQTLPLARSPVDDGELQRILSIPHAQGHTEAAHQEIRDLIEMPEGTMKLRDVQLDMLASIRAQGGMLGMIGVGSGKTLVSLCASLVTPCERPLLMVPSSSVIEKTARELSDYWNHFNLDGRLTMMSYGELSRAQGEDALYEIRPDLIIADEAHLLANRQSARTGRLQRYITYHGPKFVAMTGTMTKTSIKDYAHLSSWALGEGAPLPLTWPLLQSWALCTDPPGGHGFPTRRDWQTLEKFVFDFGDWPAFRDAKTKRIKRKHAREAIRQRLTLTSGVEVTDTFSSDVPLHLTTWQPPRSTAIDNALMELEATWDLPNGDMLTRAVEVGAARRQVALGFHYFWDWPDGVIDGEWLDARAEWHRELRAITKRPRRGIDTPRLIEENILAGGQLSRRPSLVEAYQLWCQVRDRPAPPVGVAWLDHDRVAYAASYAEDDCIIWYLDNAVADELECNGVDTYRAGQQPPTDGGRKVALSLRSHGKAYNLQAWNRNLFLGNPSSAVAVEQTLGRTHRQGQTRPVYAEFLDDGGAHKKALTVAKERATMIERTTNQPQRLLKGEWK